MPRKNNSTPIKPSEGATTSHEAEEWQHDISKVQEEVQQISLSQRATKNEMDVLKKSVEAKMDGLKKGMEATMEGLKDGMEEKMEGLKEDMEGLKEGFSKLIQGMAPNGEKIVEETHDEEKENVHHDFIKSNVGGKSHHIPKMDMRKFDGKDLLATYKICHIKWWLNFSSLQETIHF